MQGDILHFDVIAPYAFFIFAVLAGGAAAARRIWRLGTSSDELNRAEESGRLSPSVRRAWLRHRIAFATAIVATIVITAWLLYSLDQMLRF